MQQQYEAGEAKMERACEVAEKLEPFLKEHNIHIEEISECIDFFRQQKWGWFKEKEAPRGKQDGDTCSECKSQFINGYCDCVPF